MSKKQSWTLLIALAIGLWVSPGLRAAEADPGALAPTRSEDTNAQEVLRSYLQLQEQIHATELAIERSRQEAARAAEQSGEALNDRLRAIEQALDLQRAKELDAMQSNNRVMLIVAVTFAGVGLLAMVLMAYFQWRTVNRLAAISTALPAVGGLGPGSPLAALGPGDPHQVTVAPAEQSSLRLLGALEQLDKRLQQLEHSGPAHALEAPGSTNGNGPASLSGNGDAAPHGEAVPVDTRVQMLLGKGQTLLSLDNTAEALACFEEVLRLDPTHTDALLKKGTTLERLRQFDAAMACYDRALEINAALIIAHLHKGGLLNRLERFDEALACYEEALRCQEKQSRAEESKAAEAGQSAAS